MALIQALFLDRKTFADDETVIALGATVQGQKVALGFVQTATKNTRICVASPRELVARGLRCAQGVLVVIEGRKGLRRTVQDVLGAVSGVRSPGALPAFLTNYGIDSPPQSSREAVD